MVETIKGFLEKEVRSASVALGTAYQAANACLQEQNKKRRVARRVAGKPSRKEKSNTKQSRKMPERVTTYKELARLHVSNSLLKYLDLLQEKRYSEALDHVRRKKLLIGTDRQNELIASHFYAYLDELAARFSRWDTERVSDKEGGWNENEIRAMLSMRAKLIKMSVGFFELRQASSSIAASLYLRERARLAVIERFIFSNHFCSFKKFSWAASILETEVSQGLVGIENGRGREAWKRAVNDLKGELEMMFESASAC